jgi:sugar phosphate isomerase/epimerase
MKLKRLIYLTTLILSTTSLGFLLIASSLNQTQNPEQLGWKLAYQSYSFRKFTFEEGLQKASGLGLKYVEAYRRQQLSKENTVETHFAMDISTRQEMKRLLDKYGITLINYGVVKGESEEEWRQIFEFANDMGVETLVAEPLPEHLDFLEKMCDRYEINMAIHNHPYPSFYWHPDTVRHYLSGRSSRMGVCADTGHWVRSGLDPLECLRKLHGMIISLHLKDLNEKSRNAHDVPWGTGVSDIPALLQELKEQKFKGVFSIEYEYNWDNNVPEISQSIENFKQIVSNLK